MLSQAEHGAEQTWHLHPAVISASCTYVTLATVVTPAWPILSSSWTQRTCTSRRCRPSYNSATSSYTALGDGVLNCMVRLSLCVLCI